MATRADIGALLALAEAEWEPAPEKTILAAAGLLSGLPSQKSVGFDAAASLKIFAMGLDDVPADLLAKAVKQASRECVFRPSPAELRAFIADDLAERFRRLCRLRNLAAGKYL